MLRLVEGSHLPKHLLVDDNGIAYARDFTVRDKSCPQRFSGPARPRDSAGPPFTTIVFGLEMGRFDMRERFLKALRTDARAGRPPPQRPAQRRPRMGARGGRRGAPRRGHARGATQAARRGRHRRVTPQAVSRFRGGSHPAGVGRLIVCVRSRSLHSTTGCQHESRPQSPNPQAVVVLTLSA